MRESKNLFKPNSIPKFLKVRPVPYVLKQRIEIELERMVIGGILEPVHVSEWATSIILVIKDDASTRICSDYKLTANQVSQLDDYPVAKIDTLFAEISGCYKFAKLDLKHAYQQMLQDELSRELLTINTYLELF